MALKIGDWAKLTRHPREVGVIREIRGDGTCEVISAHDDVLTMRGFTMFDPSQIEEWEPATDDDVFAARFLNGVDYDDWWRCRYCCTVEREPYKLEHEGDCPVREALTLRRTLAELERAQPEREQTLLAEVANFLANEGYPWTANMLRDGSWRNRS